MFRLVVLLFLPLAASGATRESETVECDVVVAGGSTASLAAAITAAEAAKELTVSCIAMMPFAVGVVSAAAFL